MSKEVNKNYGKSIRTKLLNVAKREDVFQILSSSPHIGMSPLLLWMDADKGDMSMPFLTKSGL